MEVRILGPVEFCREGMCHPVPVRKERALLAALALQVGHSVPTWRLIDALWGEEPPATAAKTLQGHVSRLRQIVGHDLLATEAAGYRLALPPSHVDVIRFEGLVSFGEVRLDAAEFAGAAAAMRDALDLWRGEPLTDLAESDVRKGQLTRLRELQLLAREGLIDAELGMGHHDRMIPEIEALIGEDPFREHQWGRLMVALYRAGRQAEALRCYGELEELLVEQLGIDPSPEMQRLQLKIVEQDPDLDFVPVPLAAR
jgi:DNA-binding SARP family transcriptional activator